MPTNVSDDAAAIAAAQLAAALITSAKIRIEHTPEMEALSLYQRLFNGIKRQNR